MNRKKRKEIKSIPKGHFADICRNFARNKTAMAALAVLILILITALFADVIVDYRTKVLAQDPRMRLLSPSADHWFGTDNFGRDLFGRIIHGARYSLFFGIACTAISLAVGCVLGATAAYYGGIIDNIIMRITDTVMCIPFLLLALTIVAVGGPGLRTLTIAITVASVPGFTRMVRSVVLSVVSKDFIEAAKSCGTKDAAIIFGAQLSRNGDSAAHTGMGKHALGSNEVLPYLSPCRCLCRCGNHDYRSVLQSRRGRTGRCY